jgi:hypothetical protein
MLPALSYLRKNLSGVIEDLDAQGHNTAGLKDELSSLPESYDALLAFAGKLKNLPLRPDWAYAEPFYWADIEGEMDKNRSGVLTGPGDRAGMVKKAEAAFLASVLGCILGKPLEIQPSLAELKKAGEACGEWPLKDFISETFLEALGRRHRSWIDTTRGKIRYVAPDDDIHYTILGMINLENYGLNLDLDGVRNTWWTHQCMGNVWGPERTMTAWVAVNALLYEDDTHRPDEYYHEWASLLNPGTELCGACIRADAYGYAFPGRPDLAAKYAYIDASFTHRRTGIYSTMYIAAAISLMFNASDPVQPFVDALLFIPRRSRFYQNTKLCLEMVKGSASFDEAYERIHHRFADYGHCRVYQEVGTLINTLRFAGGIWDGLCKQVMQGNDTDSFGCTAGSLLGSYYGYDALPQDKLSLFNDELRVNLASFHEHSLSALARRMGKLQEKFWE